MKKLFLTILFLLIPVFASAVQVVNVSADRSTITITGVASDWTWTETFPQYPNGIRIHSIFFNPAATDDKCRIEDYDDNDIIHFYSKCADAYDQRIQYYNGQRCKLVLDYSDGTYTAGSSVTIKLWNTQEDD